MRVTSEELDRIETALRDTTDTLEDVAYATGIDVDDYQPIVELLVERNFAECLVCHYWRDMATDDLGDALEVCQDCRELLEGEPDEEGRDGR